MGEQQKNSTQEKTAVKLPRPVLVVSEHTVSEYATVLEHLLVGLAAQSVQVALVYPAKSSPDFVIPHTVELIKHPVFDVSLINYQSINILAERLNSFKPTCLHCLCETKALLTRRLAKRLDLPYILMINTFQKWWSRFVISSRRCAKIIVPTGSIAANIARVCPGFTERIERISLGTFANETIICFQQMGRVPTIVTIHPLNNIDDFKSLLTAVKHLSVDGYEFLLAGTGGGRDERKVRRLLADLDLLQVVVIVPRLQPLSALITAGDIFVQPVAACAFNPLLLEAMGVGTAIAACRGGVDDLIIDGETAVIFDPHDPLSVKACLKKLLDNRDFARQIARSAQQYLRKNHTVSKMVSAFLATYNELGGTAKV